MPLGDAAYLAGCDLPGIGLLISVPFGDIAASGCNFLHAMGNEFVVIVGVDKGYDVAGFYAGFTLGQAGYEEGIGGDGGLHATGEDSEGVPSVKNWHF